MSRDLVLSSGALVDEDGILQPLTVQSITARSTVLSGHDALYSWPQDWATDGTPALGGAADTGLPRVNLGDAATSRVKWQWAIPVGWNSIAIRLGWTKEGAGNGNVRFQLAYRAFTLVEAGTVDSAVDNSIAFTLAAPTTQFAWTYSTPTEIASIATPTGPVFADAPLMMFSLSRLGADGADTQVGAISPALVTATRAS